MSITFSKRRDDGRTLVYVEDVLVGAVYRRNMLGRGYSKSFMSTRHILQWTPIVRDVEGLELDEHDRRLIEGHITRSKTTRTHAADHLVDAYVAAGVPFPPASDEHSKA